MKFIVAAVGAGISTYISEVNLAEEEKFHFSSLQGEFAYGSRETSILTEGFSFERRMSSWFSLGAEIVTSQFLSPGYSTFGAGMGPQFRWYPLGHSRFSPYIGYNANFFYSWDEFPQNGSNFTFRLIYMLGLEYQIQPEQRVRFSIGHLHHSNNNIYPQNPGYDGVSGALSYVWMW